MIFIFSRLHQTFAAGKTIYAATPDISAYLKADVPVQNFTKPYDVSLQKCGNAQHKVRKYRKDRGL